MPNLHLRSQSLPMPATQPLQVKPQTAPVQTAPDIQAQAKTAESTSEPGKGKSESQTAQAVGGEAELKNVQNRVQNTHSQQLQQQSELVDDLMGDLLGDLMPDQTPPSELAPAAPVITPPSTPAPNVPGFEIKVAQQGILESISEQQHTEQDLPLDDKSAYDLLFNVTDPKASLQDQADSFAFHQFAKNEHSYENVAYTLALKQLAHDPEPSLGKLAGIVHDFVDTQTAASGQEINISSKERHKIIAALTACKKGTGQLQTLIELLNQAGQGAVMGNLKDTLTRFKSWRLGADSNGMPATSTFKKPTWFDQVNFLRSEQAKVKAQLDALGITLREGPKAQKVKLASQLKALNAQLAPYQQHLPLFDKIKTNLRRDATAQDSSLQLLRAERKTLLIGDLKGKQAIDKKIAEREGEILKNLEARIEAGNTLALNYQQFLSLQTETDLPVEFRGMDSALAQKISAGRQAGSLPAQTSLEIRAYMASESQGDAQISAFFKAVRQEYTSHSNNLSKDQFGRPDDVGELITIAHNPRASQADRTEGFAFRAYVYHEYAGEHFEFYGEMRQLLKMGLGTAGALNVDNPEFKQKLSYVLQRFIPERGADALNLSYDLRSRLEGAFHNWQARPNSHAAIGELLQHLSEAQRMSRSFLNSMHSKYSTQYGEKGSVDQGFKLHLQGESPFSPHALKVREAKALSGPKRQDALYQAERSTTVRRPVKSEATMADVFQYVGPDRFDPARRQDHYNHDFLKPTV